MGLLTWQLARSGFLCPVPSGTPTQAREGAQRVLNSRRVGAEAGAAQ